MLHGKIAFKKNLGIKKRRNLLKQKNYFDLLFFEVIWDFVSNDKFSDKYWILYFNFGQKIDDR